MLRRLSIRNLAIIDAVEIELAPGFTVLTGETGAGKSILIDALGLIAGLRADSSLVRAGAMQAEVAAEFDLGQAPAAHGWLGEQSLLDADEPGTLLLRRLVAAEGRTRAFVNGTPVAAGQLRELGERLIEIFGQHDSQTLLKPEVQRARLDGFGVDESLLGAVRSTAQRWQMLETELKAARAAGTRDPAQLDYLRHQVRELEALGLGDGEIEQLDADHRRLANAGRLLQDGSQAQEALYGELGSYDRLGEASRLLAQLAAIDPAFSSIETQVGELRELVRDAADVLKRLLEKLDLDPAQLAEVEARLASIHDLARKHRLRAEALPAQLQTLRSELEAAEGAGGLVAALLQQQAQAQADWQQAAEHLTRARGTAARQLSDDVTQRVRRLGMPNAQLVVAVEPADTRRPRSEGADEVRFDFSANPGQPPRALNKVVSGGELSRVSLALQVATQGADGVPVMVFDEVDAGIGGSVAEAVGRELGALGRGHQVLCVTHLAPVAAQGAQHLAISKDVRAEQTFTRVQPLSDAARVTELARMLGGERLGETTLAMARELLAASR